MRLKKWHLSGAILVVTALACGGSSSSDGDSGDTGADTGAADTDTAEMDTDDTGGGGVIEEGLVMLADPCLGAGTPYGLLFRDGQEGFVGCGNGYGLWRTEDGGETFTRAHPSADLYVFQLTLDPEGRLLVCGRDYETSKGMLYREDGTGWELLMKYGTNPSAPQEAAISNCGAVAAQPDGRMIAASLTSGDLLTSEDGGQSWSAEERYWEDANLTSGGYAYYYMLNLWTGLDGTFAGAGSQITVPPTFFGPSLHDDGDWYNFHAYTVDDRIIGEVWSMGTPDDGATWVVGGRDQGATSRASGFIARSTDGGETWTQTVLPEGTDIVHDIAFDGLAGVAVGHRYPVSDGGFVLITRDGGQTWTSVVAAKEVPLLQSADIVGGTYWIAGDAFLARGTL